MNIFDSVYKMKVMRLQKLNHDMSDSIENENIVRTCTSLRLEVEIVAVVELVVRIVHCIVQQP